MLEAKYFFIPPEGLDPPGLLDPQPELLGNQQELDGCESMVAAAQAQGQWEAGLVVAHLNTALSNQRDKCNPLGMLPYGPLEKRRISCYTYIYIYVLICKHVFWKPLDGLFRQKPALVLVW